jgi:hypothetical protein
VLYGREKLPNAILYCSRDTHYSVPKSCKLYRIPVQLVDSQPNGEIDYADLEAQLLKNKGTPAIVSFNAGTTVKGAVDSSSRVIDTLHRTGYSREEFYVHCDGALAGVIVPLLDGVDKSYTVSFQKEIDRYCFTCPSTHTSHTIHHTALRMKLTGAAAMPSPATPPLACTPHTARRSIDRYCWCTTPSSLPQM